MSTNIIYSIFIISTKENQQDWMGKVLEIQGEGEKGWVLITPYMMADDNVAWVLMFSEELNNLLSWWVQEWT